MDNIVERLATESNEDETSRLRAKLESLESLRKTADSKGVELIDAEINRLSKEIEESSEREKKNM